MFPFVRGGRVVNVKYRDSEKNYSQEKDALKIFYGIDDVAGCSEIVIVEGEVDKLSVETAGIRTVISVPDGAPGKVRDGEISPEDDTKFSYLWTCWDELDAADKIILATDADEPGRALAEELARRFGKERCWRVTWPTGNDAEYKDANEVLVGEGPEVLRECIENAEPYPIASLFGVDDFYDDVIELYRSGRKVALSTGWPALDEYYRVHPGQLSIVTGTPASGKSEFLDALAVNLAESHAWKFAICSFENPTPEHLAKLAEKRLVMPFWDGPSQRMEEHELEYALEWLSQRFFFIRADSGESPTYEWVLETATYAVRRHGVRGLIIDPYNELEHQRSEKQTETEYISEMLSKIKRWALNHDVHVWFVAHPAKMAREKGSTKELVPTLYDISGSANWANKADVGLVVHRAWKSAVTELYIRKVRFKWVGHVGNLKFTYDLKTGRYQVDITDS